MKSLVEKLNDRYNRFKFYASVDENGCFDYIYDRQESINKYIENMESQKNANMRGFNISGLLSCIPFVRVSKTPEFYQEDSADIELGVLVSTDYLHYYNELLAVVNDENYVESFKLAIFMSDLYNYNIRQLEENRTRREKFYYGEEELGVCKLINKDSVDEFFYQQINSMTNKDSIEKVKK